MPSSDSPRLNPRRARADLAAARDEALQAIRRRVARQVRVGTREDERDRRIERRGRPAGGRGRHGSGRGLGDRRCCHRRGGASATGAAAGDAGRGRLGGGGLQLGDPPLQGLEAQLVALAQLGDLLLQLLQLDRCIGLVRGDGRERNAAGGGHGKAEDRVNRGHERLLRNDMTAARRKRTARVPRGRSVRSSRAEEPWPGRRPHGARRNAIAGVAARSTASCASNAHSKREGSDPPTCAPARQVLQTLATVWWRFSPLSFEVRPSRSCASACSSDAWGAITTAATRTSRRQQRRNAFIAAARVAPRRRACPAEGSQETKLKTPVIRPASLG